MRTVSLWNALAQAYWVEAMAKINCKNKVTSLIYLLKSVQKDPYPQWRQLAWSPDCTMLAYADSSGEVKVFDLVGSLLFTIDKVSVLILIFGWVHNWNMLTLTLQRGCGEGAKNPRRKEGWRKKHAQPPSLGPRLKLRTYCALDESPQLHTWSLFRQVSLSVAIDRLGRLCNTIHVRHVFEITFLWVRVILVLVEIHAMETKV